MKQFLTMALWVLGCTFLLSPVAKAQETVEWYTANGKAIDLAAAAEQMSAYDVVFFGEYHDQPAIHEAEAAFFAALLEKNPALAFSMEMFERDVQPVLDSYLRGEMTEELFLAKSRPWPNYAGDYRPLVEFAKAHAVPVLAANVPRRLAAQYAKTGTLEFIAAGDREYLPREHTPGSAAYRQNFTAYMEGGHSGMRLSPEQIARFYLAQSLKDDRMAESIADFLAAHPRRSVLHIQGEFHGRAHLGVPEKLRRLAPNLKIAVIEPVFREADEQSVLQKHKGDGDLLLMVDRQKAK